MSHRNQSVNDSIGALQWLVFLLANAVALPIVIGQIYHLSPQETAELMQRTFFVVGVSSFLQGWLGHRMPIIDGPAGTWLAVFIILGATVAQTGDAYSTLQLLEGGMIAAGVLMVALGAMGVIRRILPLFTPLVTGAYLLLLAMQLSGTFLRGIVATGDEVPRMDWGSAAVGFTVFIIIIVLSVRGRGWLQSYAMLIGIIPGCALYYLIGHGQQSSFAAADSWISLPGLFVWGAPQWDAGMIISAIPVTLILLSNAVASVSAMKQVKDGTLEPTANQMRRSTIAGGVSQLLSASFSTVGMVPISGSAGFVGMTGQRRRRPFLLACVLLAVLSLSPILIRVLTMLPGVVAYAAIMATFVQMVGIGVQTLVRDPLDRRRLMILGIGMMIGVGSMFLPSSIFETLPSAVRYIVGNGMLLGTMIIMILDRLWKQATD